jgi:uncharacterized protein (TIGR03086 family)
MTDIAELHRRSVDGMTARINAVGDDGWSAPTPCSEWCLRDLVNHVTYECLWTVPLMEGKTISEVGDAFEGDLLGADPKAAWDAAAKAAVEVVSAPGATSRTVHLSFGDFPGEEYARQMFADMLIHSWDVAKATGGDDRLDPELVSACAAWFGPMEDAYRGAGVIGPRIETPEDVDEQTRLLAAFGRCA